MTHTERNGDSDRERERERGDPEEGEKSQSVRESVGVSMGHTVQVTLETLASLCNILDSTALEKSETVRRLSCQVQVTLSLLLQTSQSARMFFLQVKEHSPASVYSGHTISRIKVGSSLFRSLTRILIKFLI